MLPAVDGKMLVLLFLAIFSVLIEVSNACTAIGITPGATVDGTPLLGHTDDAGGEAGDVRIVPVPRQYIHQEDGDMPMRSVYNWQSGYPRLVSDDRGKYYEPVEEYDGHKMEQTVFKPLGHVPDISPLEVMDEQKKIHTLSGDENEFKHRMKSHKFRYAYFDQDYGMMNEMQLSIVESTCGAKTVGWAADVPYGYNLFGIAELSKVALERCITARCAVKIMGELAEKYGFFSEDSGDPNDPGYGDSSEALILGDQVGEIWVFHVLTGEKNASGIWAAQRVKDGEITSVANGFIIREIDFDDSDNFLFSKDIKQKAINLKLWSEKDKSFDFTKVFGFEGLTPLLPLYVGRRVWRIFDWFAPSLKLSPKVGENAVEVTYPFSIKPDEKIKMKDLMSVLKDHYEGTEFDMTKGMAAGPFGNPNRFGVGHKTSVQGGWERPISIFRSLFSFVAQINALENDGILWYGPDKPHGTIYFPFVASDVSVPRSFRSGMQSKFEKTSAWRAFNFINNWAMLRYDSISREVAKYQDQIQADAFKLMQPANFCSKKLEAFREKTVEVWWNLAWDLVSKFSDGYLITGEGPGELKSLGYPDWWLNETDYAGWPGKSYTPPDQLAKKNGLRSSEIERTVFN